MMPLSGKRALVLGSDASAEAATVLLRHRGAEVEMAAAGAAAAWDGPEPALVVLGAGCGGVPPLAAELARRGVPVMGERELAFQQSLCLHVAVSGASGKSLTASLVAHLLRAAGRKVEVAGGPEHPPCALVDATRDLDLLVHVVEPAELAHLRLFRPVVAVLLNAPAEALEAGDTQGAGPGSEDAARTWARLFAQQQAFDWAVVQSEALAQLQEAGVRLPGKCITFSATSRQADLGLERGLLVSRLEGWAGPLWDTNRGRLRGPHHAEDTLAALAVGRVLRLPLDGMRQALERFEPGPGRLEVLGEAEGVRFVDDSRSTSLDSLAKALLSLAPHPPDDPFLWLIAGDGRAGRHLYDLGPLMSPRVKQAFVYGEAAPAMRAAWSLFTPCSAVPSLLDAANRAMSQAVAGDTILFSPACPGRADSSLREHRGAVFREVVRERLSRPPGAVPSPSLSPATGEGAEGPPASG